MDGPCHQTAESLPFQCDFLVTGAGVAGSTCGVELKRLSPASKVVLVSPTPDVKAVRGVEQITPLLSVTDVQARSAGDFAREHPGVTLLCDEVTHIDANRRQAMLASGGVLHFMRCCVATGASPSLAAVHPRVIGIRDTEASILALCLPRSLKKSVDNLSKRMVDARKVIIVGNGGIALELVHALTSTKVCQVVWAVRDAYIGNTFFDASASAFVLPSLPVCSKSDENAPAASTSLSSSPPSSDLPSHMAGTQGSSHSGGQETKAPPTPGSERPIGPDASRGVGPQLDPGSEARGMEEVGPRKNAPFVVGEYTATTVCGAGLGPHWVKTLNTHRQPTESGGDGNGGDGKKGLTAPPQLDIQFECELVSVRDEGGTEGRDGASWPVWATLTNGVIVGCDFVISATGVQPNTGVLGAEFERGSDGGLLVDETMRVVLRPSNPGETQDEQHGSQHSSADAGKPEARSHVCSTANVPQDAIFAAGDCCRLEWPTRESAHWFQVRLWSQAREMGLYAAKCMTNSVDELGSGGAFDLFVHSTLFFGHRVALLGHFNGQGLGVSVQDFVSKHLVVDPNTGGVAQQAGGVETESGDSTPTCPKQPHPSRNSGTSDADVSDDIQVLVRTTPGMEYVKVILVRGRVRGAMLIGDTGLEETFENLILNGTDVSEIGADLLSLDLDIEDFFD